MRLSGRRQNSRDSSEPSQRFGHTCPANGLFADSYRSDSTAENLVAEGFNPQLLDCTREYRVISVEDKMEP